MGSSVCFDGILSPKIYPPGRMRLLTPLKENLETDSATCMRPVSLAPCGIYTLLFSSSSPSGFRHDAGKNSFRYDAGKNGVPGNVLELPPPCRREAPALGADWGGSNLTPLAGMKLLAPLVENVQEDDFLNFWFAHVLQGTHGFLMPCLTPPKLLESPSVEDRSSPKIFLKNAFLFHFSSLFLFPLRLEAPGAARRRSPARLCKMHVPRYLSLRVGSTHSFSHQVHLPLPGMTLGRMAFRGIFF